MRRFCLIKAQISENVSCQDDRKILVGAQIKQLFENNHYATQLSGTE